MENEHGENVADIYLASFYRKEIFSVLDQILNFSVKANEVPSTLKITKVVRIHKKGSYNDPENY